VNSAALIFDISLVLCRLQDVAGYGVALAVKDIYSAAFGERNLDSDLVDLIVRNGRQGTVLQS
jgi:enoyl-CoA hydratase/3-hydroxyacyl-CoA dehydrogenase